MENEIKALYLKIVKLLNLVYQCHEGNTGNVMENFQICVPKVMWKGPLQKHNFNTKADTQHSQYFAGNLNS